MPVRIVNRHRIPRGNRGRHFDLAVENLAPTIRQLQLAGIRDIRQLAQRLNDDGALAPSGRPFSYGAMRRVLVRLQELHLGLGPRSLKAVAAGRPRPEYKFRPRKSRRMKIRLPSQLALGERHD
jgi:hypothetical protein